MPDDAYLILGRIIGAETAGTPIVVSPGTELDDIAGWDSIALAGVLAEIERLTGRAADRDRIDHLRSVDDLAGLLSA